MDTKSKNINYRYSIWFKLLAIVFGLAGATILFLGVTKWEGIGAYLSDRISGRQSSFLDKDQYDNYSPSGTEFINDMRQVVELYYDVYVFYQSEEHIKNGGTVTDDRIMAYEDQYRQEYNTTIANLYDEYDLQIENSRAQGNTALTQSLTRERDSQIEYYENVYQQNIDGVAQEIINEDLLVFSDVRERLEKVSGYCYTVFDSNGNYVSGAKKSRQDYEHMPFYMTGRDMSGDNGFYWDTIVNLQMPDGQILLVGLEQEKYDTLQTAYQQSVEEGGKGVAQVFIGFGLCLGALVWLLAIAGKKPSTGKEIHLTILDKPYLDILLVVCAIGVGCLIAFSVMILGDAIIDIPMNEVTGFQINYRTRMFAIATGIVMFWGIDLLGTWFFTAFVKRLRMGSAVRHTLIYKVCHFFWKIFRRIKRSVRDFFRVMAHRHPTGRYAIAFGGINLVLAAVISFFCHSMDALFIALVFGAVATAVETYVVKRRAVALEKIKEDIWQIKEGELSHKVRSTGVEDIDQIASNVNRLSDGLKDAVEKQVKSERMKVELITNVSHDLKTPLTSMVNYLDLLKNEQLTPEYANDYVKVIDQKLSRLRLMVQDLFDIAKVQSGNMEMHFERIDLNDLIEQSLAENEDRMRQNNLAFKVDMPKEHVYIRADGRKLWRVFDNLIGNAVKYSLDNTRVYIKVVKGDCATISIKNVANYEMDFDVGEITERFSRADKARSTEGSGLGLSIAQSFLRAQGGALEITVDGDLFKVNVTMPLYQESNEKVPQTEENPDAAEQNAQPPAASLEDGAGETNNE